MKVKIIETFATERAAYSAGEIGEVRDEEINALLAVNFIALLEEDETPKVKMKRNRSFNIENK